MVPLQRVQHQKPTVFNFSKSFGGGGGEFVYSVPLTFQIVQRAENCKATRSLHHRKPFTSMVQFRSPRRNPISRCPVNRWMTGSHHRYVFRRFSSGWTRWVFFSTFSQWLACWVFFSTFFQWLGMLGIFFHCMGLLGVFFSVLNFSFCFTQSTLLF